MRPVKSQNKSDAVAAIRARATERMLSRQLPLRWGSKYLPAISAQFGNAPSKSQASERYSVDLARYVAAHGTAAKAFTAFGLRYGRLIDLHEEAILIPRAHPHPVSCHPKFQSVLLPGTSGTVEIARRLGVFRWHPKVWKPPTKKGRTGKGRDEPGKWMMNAWVDDIQLFLMDEHGPYMVSWDIKKEMDGHGQPSPWARGRDAPRKAEVREQVYQAYMDELKAPIVRLSLDSMPEALGRNLAHLFLKHSVRVKLSVAVVRDLVGEFQRALASGDAANKVIHKFGARGVDRDASKLVFEQAVWKGTIRVDWFEPIVVDVPLGPERKDPYSMFAHWFRRQS